MREMMDYSRMDQKYENEEPQLELDDEEQDIDIEVQN